MKQVRLDDKYILNFLIVPRLLMLSDDCREA